MSFDPDQVMALKELAPKLPRGIVAQRTYDDDYWTKAVAAQRHEHDCAPARLPHPAAFRRLLGQRAAGAGAVDRPQHFGCPLLTWTVRTPEQRARAARYADQMIFEGFVPES